MFDRRVHDRGPSWLRLNPRTSSGLLYFMLASLAVWGCGEDGTAPETDLPPDPVQIDSIDAESFVVTLSWSPSSASDFAHYSVQRSRHGLPSFANSPNPDDATPTDPRLGWVDLATLAQPGDTSWTDTLVSPQHQYTYRISTFDETGQFAPSDSVAVRTDPAAFPVLGLEPRFVLDDVFKGEAHLWIDGLPDSSLEVMGLVVEFELPESSRFLSCDVLDRPLPNWIALCQSDDQSAALAWSPLPGESPLSEGTVLADLEIQILIAEEFAPRVVEVQRSTGEVETSAVAIRGILGRRPGAQR